ncbi:hypothetical protein SBA3_2550018 [Candidatus Sulfopaludibacter sp. SbA3]|nr:hypothetical protein SBA3_2550018 [Candidatus Sulfopaludibacter sp. SbA3]
MHCGNRSNCRSANRFARPVDQPRCLRTHRQATHPVDCGLESGSAERSRRDEHCPFCVASAPFYRRLAGLVHDSATGGATLVVASPETQDVTKKFLDERQIVADKVLSVPLRSLDVSGTPTLLVVDGRGFVKRAYAGKLNDSNEAGVLQAVREAGRRAN